MLGRCAAGWRVGVLMAAMAPAGAWAGGTSSIFDDDWKPPTERVAPKQDLPGTREANPSSAEPGKGTGQGAAEAPAGAAGSHAAKPQAAGNGSGEAAAPPTVAPVAAQAIPAAALRARSRKLLKEVYAEKLKDRSPKARRELAATLLDQVGSSSGNPADQYVLLAGAIEAAKEAQSLELAFQAIDRMTALFVGVDALAAKHDAATAVLTAPTFEPDDGANVRLAGEVETQLAADNDFVDARRILSGMLRRATRANDRAVASRTQTAIKDLDAAQAAWDAFRAKVERLKTSPTDPAANSIVGAFLCFTKGQWNQGLPYLSRGDSADFRAAAAAELQLPADAKAGAIVSAADAWWDLAGQQPANRRAHVLEHAGTLYQRAESNLTGLQLAVVQKRMASIGMVPAESAGAPLSQGTMPQPAGASHETVASAPPPAASVSPSTESRSPAAASPDLLKLVDPKLDAVSGVWKEEGSGVGLDSADFGLIRIPFAPPMEYDFTVTFTRRQLRGAGDVSFIVARGDEHFAANIGGGSNHISFLVGADSQHGLESHSDETLKDNRLYTVRVEVRKDTIAAYLDDALITQGKAPIGHSEGRNEQFPGAGVLGLGAYDSVVFHSAVVTPVTGMGHAVTRTPIGELPALNKPAPHDPVLRTIDLLPLIDAGKDTVEGTAKFDDQHHLITAKQRTRVRIPYQPPEEYDFRMVFRRIEGTDYIAQLVPAWDRGILWGMGTYRNRFSGFERIHGGAIRENATTVEGLGSFVVGQPYESVVYVRKGKVSASINGKLISEVASDGQDIVAPGVWMRGVNTIGFGASDSIVAFDAAELREITGKGKPLAHRELVTLGKPAPHDKAIRVVNLLPVINPDKDNVSGTRGGRGMGINKGPTGAAELFTGWHARVRIPYHPPAEYDLHVRFRKLEGDESFGVVFSHGASLGEFQIGARGNALMGFTSLKGHDLDGKTATVKGDWLLLSEHSYDLVVHVRNKNVAVSLDGQLVAEPTDWSDISVTDEPQAVSQALGLRNYDNKMMYEAIDIREITGEGRPSPRNR